MWLQHRMKVRWLLGSALILFSVSCVFEDGKEFREASITFFGCTMEPPWPVELISEEESGVTFARKDHQESPPFNFLRTEAPSWDVLPHVRPESLKVERYPPFEVAHFTRAHPDERIDLAITATIIRRDGAELFLPSELSTYWEELLDSCLEGMPGE